MVVAAGDARSVLADTGVPGGAVRRGAPAEAPRAAGLGSISVVVPARDEAARIGPLLDALRAAPGVSEIVVVDDESSDGTGEVARRAGVRVVDGASRPAGWAGKTWALQQGIQAAEGDWIVALDADARPDPRLPLAAVVRAVDESADLLTLAGRFDCPTPGATWLHAAMLTTLVYRFGAPGSGRRPPAHRTMANGQCMIARRDQLLAAGGLTPVAGEFVEDVALARRLASVGWQVEFIDAADLLEVRMYEDFATTWAGWGRSLGLPGVEPTARRVLDVAILGSTTVLPAARALAGRLDALDVALLALRLGTLVGTARAYRRTGPAYWLSPLADPVALVALAAGLPRRRRAWRGRRYLV